MERSIPSLRFHDSSLAKIGHSVLERSKQDDRSDKGALRGHVLEVHPTVVHSRCEGSHLDCIHIGAMIKQ